MKKRDIVIISGILIFVIMTISATSAFSQKNSQLLGLNFFDEVKDSECSSIFLQVSENQSVASFRRDENNAADILIENGSWEDISYIKQYKREDGEFFQALITQNGYIIGVGGDTDGYYNKQIENITSKMVLSDNPAKYISQIQDILSGYEKGHFIIKNPDGTYYVVWPTESSNGKLNPGEYICVPNMEKYSFLGNFDSDPIDESIEIARNDIFGIDRRNIVVYDVQKNDSRYIVDVFVSNDDGSKRLSNTAHLKDNLTYMGDFHHADSIPLTPNKLHLGTYKFNKKFDNFFDWFWDAIHKK